MRLTVCPLKMYLIFNKPICLNCRHQNISQSKYYDRSKIWERDNTHKKMVYINAIGKDLLGISVEYIKWSAAFSQIEFQSFSILSFHRLVFFCSYVIKSNELYFVFTYFFRISLSLPHEREEEWERKVWGKRNIYKVIIIILETNQFNQKAIRSMDKREMRKQCHWPITSIYMLTDYVCLIFILLAIYDQLIC